MWMVWLKSRTTILLPCVDWLTCSRFSSFSVYSNIFFFLKCAKVLTYLFKNAVELASTIFIKSGRLGQQKHYPETLPRRGDDLAESHQLLLPESRRTLEGSQRYSPAGWRTAKDSRKCSVLSKRTEIGAVSINTAYSVPKHQVSQSAADLHPRSRPSPVATSPALHPTWLQEWTTGRDVFTSYSLQNI